MKRHHCPEKYSCTVDAKYLKYNIKSCKLLVYNFTEYQLKHIHIHMRSVTTIKLSFQSST